MLMMDRLSGMHPEGGFEDNSVDCLNVTSRYTIRHATTRSMAAVFILMQVDANFEWTAGIVGYIYHCPKSPAVDPAQRPNSAHSPAHRQVRVTERWWVLCGYGCLQWLFVRRNVRQNGFVMVLMAAPPRTSSAKAGVQPR